MFPLPCAAGLADMNVHFAGPTGKGPEVPVEFVATAQLHVGRFQLRGISGLVAQVGDADLDVDHGLGWEPGDSSRTDMLRPHPGCSERTG